MTEEAILEVPLKDELTLLKERAKKMGIPFHPSIGVETLREKVKAVLEDIKPEVKEVVVPAVKEVVPETKAQVHARLRKEATALVRIRVTCMNPGKKAWKGEVVSVSNRFIGTVKRMIPFDAENGWHIEKVLLNMLKERVYQSPYYVKGPRGQKIRRHKLIKEFAIEILDPLTPTELKDLATQQAMAGNID